MNLVRVYAVVLRHLYHWSRSLNKITDTFWWPLVDLLVWGLMTVYVSRSAQGVLPDIIFLFLSGLILWTIVYRNQWEVSMTLTEEIWSQNLMNLFASPLTIWEFLAASVILAFLKLLGVLFFMLIIAHFLYAYEVFRLGFHFLPFVAVLMVLGWSVGIIINSFLLRFGRNAEALAWTAVFLIQPFTAVYYPVSFLPIWAQNIAYLVPSTYIFEGLRSLIFGAPFPFFNWGMALFLDLVYLTAALVLFKVMFEKAKEKGLITRLLE